MEILLREAIIRVIWDWYLPDDPRYTRNSKGKIVPIQELGWGKADEEVTHVMLRFSANDQGAYIGSVGSKFWVDNVAFVY